MGQEELVWAIGLEVHWTGWTSRLDANQADWTGWELMGMEASRLLGVASLVAYLGWTVPENSAKERLLAEAKGLSREVLGHVYSVDT